MPQTPPQPPTLPVPPGPPDLSLTLPEIAGTKQSVPTTTQMLQGLRERREILRDYLERAATKRSELVSQLNSDGDNAVPREARVGIQARIDLVDQRIMLLERDQALTEQLISNAPPEVLAASEAESRTQQNFGNMISEDDAAGIAFATFGGGVVLTLLISRLRRGWRNKRGTPATASTASSAMRDDPRIDRLTQTVEAIAEEVERIGEGQRFVTQLLANRPASALQGEPLAAEAQRR